MGYFPHNPRLSTRRAQYARMHAYVYKSQRKADTFVYLATRDDFARLPEPLRTQLGELAFVLEVALTPERKLSREDIAVVLENLDKQGYHLQMPPAEDEYIEHLPEELLRRNDPM